jgi:hypothetical protein
MIKKILVFAFFLSQLTIAQLVQPRLMAQPTTHDFGKIKQGEVVSYTFILTNGGGDLLKIDNVTATCGCTVAKPEKNELIPGESTNLKVTFNSAGRHGKQSKLVKIFSNDPENPQLSLTITGTVVVEDKVTENRPIVHFPETEHNFGKVTEGSVVEYTFKFKNAGGSSLNVKDIRTSCGCTAALVSKEKLQPGEEGTIRIELDTKNRSGKMSRTITVMTNDPVDPNKVLTVYAEIEKAG